MKFFADKNGDTNWAAIGGVSAVIGTLLALLTFVFPLSQPSANSVNIEAVLGDNVVGDKIVGISLEQYENGLKRREDEIRNALEKDDLTSEEIRNMRDTLQKIDSRQLSISTAYEDVSLLTSYIRAYHENSEDPEVIKEAINAIFDGDTSSATRLSIRAGIPVKSLGTIESLTGVFQEVETETDFMSYVAGRDLIQSNNVNYVVKIGRNGSLNGFYWGIRDLSGSWSWLNGKYCREFNYKDKHHPERCDRVFATNTAVKFVDPSGKSHIWSKK